MTYLDDIRTAAEYRNYHAERLEAQLIKEQTEAIKEALRTLWNAHGWNKTRVPFLLHITLMEELHKKGFYTVGAFTERDEPYTDIFLEEPTHEN